VKLHTVHIKKPMKELVGRKRESAKKEDEKHHPIAARGLGDSLGGGEDDGVIVGDETICFGLLQLLLRESRGYPARRGIRRFPLAILFFAAEYFTRIYDLHSGAMQENSRMQRLQ
jgi:hypothetical protein